MDLTHKIFTSIETAVPPTWLAIPLKVAATSLALLGALTFARLLARILWVEVSVRSERRCWYPEVLDYASKIGVHVGDPAWRKKLPRSWIDLERRNPMWLFRYAMARRLTRQISAKSLEKMAKRRNLLENLSRTPMRVLKLLSRRSLILLVSGVVVYRHERPGGASTDLRAILDRIPMVADQRAWAPTLVLTIGFFAFTRSGNLIDRIRARDEAAKDANRLLTELLAKLSELDVALQEVYENCDSYRSAYLDVASGAAESGRLAWSPRFGFESDRYMFRTSLYGRKTLEILLEEREFQRLQSTLDSVADHLADMRSKGISSVALRILTPVWAEIYDCRLQWHLHPSRAHHTIGIRDSMLGLGWLKERLESKERQFGRLFKEGELDDRDKLDSMLVEESYRLDELILQSKMAHSKLQKIESFLLKRLHGTSLTKLVSAVGHK
ncbi:hypothetical protein G3I40_27425 [Streptomyces sp. SID14478]|uniref:hypothetical protein n=1 Tax=Streptomyces sp. SID14478 TaxID=2706073 RepID=UPI0013DA0576|nr:hypothetical protein [Streptomyces sp. SID14478]NEB78921.1 hypothetical protein [Streptomyces sp. SID14478]